MDFFTSNKPLGKGINFFGYDPIWIMRTDAWLEPLNWAVQTSLENCLIVIRALHDIPADHCIDPIHEALIPAI